MIGLNMFRLQCRHTAVRGQRPPKRSELYVRYPEHAGGLILRSPTGVDWEIASLVNCIRDVSGSDLIAAAHGGKRDLTADLADDRRRRPYLSRMSCAGVAF